MALIACDHHATGPHDLCWENPGDAIEISEETTGLKTREVHRLVADLLRLPGFSEVIPGQEPATEPEQTNDAPPPKAGPKGSADAWRAYAEAWGVAVDESAKRDEIIEALEAAGVPTE